MSIEIDVTESDDPLLVAAFEDLVQLISMHPIKDEAFIVRVDNWFDDKWYGYSGKRAVHIDSGMPNSALNTQIVPVWKGLEDVTVPPFSPNRILSESHFKWVDDGYQRREFSDRRIHTTSKRRSGENLKNRLIDISASCLFVWFAANSRANGRSSALFCRTHDGLVHGWYMSFRQAPEEWKVDRVKGVNRELLERFFADSLERAAVRHAS